MTSRLVAAAAAVARRARPRARAAPSRAPTPRRRSATATVTVDQFEQLLRTSSPTPRRPASPRTRRPARSTATGPQRARPRSSSTRRRASSWPPTARRSPTRTARRSSTDRGRRPGRRHARTVVAVIVDAQAARGRDRRVGAAGRGGRCSAAYEESPADARRGVRAPGRGRRRRTRPRTWSTSSTTARRSPTLAPSARSTRRRRRTAGRVELSDGPALHDARRRRRPALDGRRSSTPPSTSGRASRRPGETDVRLARHAGPAVRRGRRRRSTALSTPAPGDAAVRAASSRDARRRASTPATGAGTPRTGTVVALVTSRRDRPDRHRRRARAGGHEHVTVETLDAIAARPAPLPAHGPAPERPPRARRGDLRRPLRVGRPLRRRVRGDRRSARRRGRRARRGALRGARFRRSCSSARCARCSPTTGSRCDVLPAMSFLDVAWARLGIDPVEAACDSSTGTSSPSPRPARPGALLIAHTHADWVLSDIKLAVEEATGDEPVVILQRPRHAGRADHRDDVERARPRRRAPTT